MHVLRVAEETGTSVDIISIQNGNPDWQGITESFSRKTGGRATVAADWRQQSSEFAKITGQIVNSYVVAYRPEPRAVAGYRKVEIKLKDHPNAARAAIQTRHGYWAKASEETPAKSALFTSLPRK